MLLSADLVRQAEVRFGAPRELSLEAGIDGAEMDVVAGSMRKLRVHDVTLFIVDQDEIVVISKPWFPPGAYRAPSGGVHAGETLEEGALREGLEETGLTLRLERYLLRIAAIFRPTGPWPGVGGLPAEVTDPLEPSALHWWSHVFSARVVGDRTLDPRDTWEIAEARWVSVADLQGPIRETLLGTGKGLFGYRVALTDATVGLMRESGLL
jgi:ADP-ribose pyrophosphatase YjhB (NUDIX family)